MAAWCLCRLLCGLDGDFRSGGLRRAHPQPPIGERQGAADKQDQGAPFGVGLAIFVMAGALTDLAERTMILRVPFGRGVAARGGAAALGLGHGVCALPASRSSASSP